MLISKFSKAAGISAYTLRYYEKKGVVKPTKDPDNDYRYYDAWDINFLMDCLWFKNFGFSIEQIAEMVRIPSARQLSTLFYEKEDELRATITRCELLLRRSEEHRRRADPHPQAAGQVRAGGQPGGHPLHQPLYGQLRQQPGPAAALPGLAGPNPLHQPLL